jgi:hypothetical protein
MTSEGEANTFSRLIAEAGPGDKITVEFNLDGSISLGYRRRVSRYGARYVEEQHYTADDVELLEIDGDFVEKELCTLQSYLPYFDRELGIDD